MLTLDMDNTGMGFIKRFKNECKYKAILYSIHSYESVHPRVKIIIPLSRNVGEVEFIALPRLFVNKQGIKQFDSCLFVISPPNRTNRFNTKKGIKPFILPRFI